MQQPQLRSQVGNECTDGRWQALEAPGYDLQLTLGPGFVQRDCLQVKRPQVWTQNIARQDADAQIGRDHPAHAFKAGHTYPLAHSPAE